MRSLRLAENRQSQETARDKKANMPRATPGTSASNKLKERNKIKIRTKISFYLIHYNLDIDTCFVPHSLQFLKADFVFSF